MLIRRARNGRLYLALTAALVVACGGATPATTPSGSLATGSPSPALSSAASPKAIAPTPGETVPATRVPDPSPTDAPTGSGSPAAAPGWSELDVTGDAPAAVEDHTWTIDSSGSAAYLFGGRAGGQESDELWRYDLADDSWTRLDVAGSRPAARFGHVAVWVDEIGLVVWSGQAGSRFFTDIWAYDPDAGSWQELAANGDVPAPRYGSCGAIGPDGRLWISHGFTEDEGRFSDTRAYDFSSGTWEDMTPGGRVPVERCLHDCLWTPDGRFLLYAGQTTGVPAIGDVWTYQPTDASWTAGAEPEPAPRQLYALATVGANAYVFGGGSAEGRMLDDLWQLDLEQISWTKFDLAGPSPVGRAGATLVSDPARSRLLLFGGATAKSELNDLWQLSLVPPDGND
ncbi:MAG TPA: kelch repeat-containing protein [Candidatus Caenarcaniphilales bacterium]|nr:kelch repeat-containing protein [Candidatus Caenarcaniphilales bacterium]